MLQTVVIGSEEQGIAHCRHIVEQGTGSSKVVTDQNRTGRRAVAFP
ncbi:hypothetical protein MiTs_03689 [Microcystis aeruginosa NIES-2521]|uniref:Uncharacterized protein n=1 Tax=Microcystis aeruginosa NIES-2521 TaxID=2303983 RepID=A0A5A5RZT9_MICAE|nr:hypothetical protein MiTs_03689 [Microcystis aeruginosa NIES-2521]